MYNPLRYALTLRRPLVGASLLVVLALLATGYWLFFVRGIVYSDDARIDGDLADLAPQINGALSDVLVREGDHVTKGQPLFSLDKRGLEAAVEMTRAGAASAKADLAVQEAQLERAVNGTRPEEIQEAKARVERFAVDERFSSGELARLKDLREKNVSSQSDLDKAQAAYESAHQSLKEAEHQLNLLEEGTRPEDIKAAKATVELARGRSAEADSALRQSEVNLSYALGEAPFDGVVVRRWMHPGEAILAGQPVLTELNPATVHVSANVEEVDLDRILVGDRVDISIDSYPELRLKGRVEKILRATNSKFSLIPAEGVSGTFIKVVQRVPVWIALDNSPDFLLSPGLSVEVHIRVGTGRSAPAGK